MRECIDCGERIGFRATRCKDCRRIHRTKYERDRVASQRRPERTGTGSSTEMHGEVVDYMRGGGPPPSFSGIGPAPARPRRDPDAPSDGRVPHPRDRVYQPGPSQLTAAQRHDRYNVEREMAAQQLAAEENDMLSWDALQAANTRLSNTVNFGRSSVDASGLRGSRPQYAITNPAAAGVLYGSVPGDYMAAAAGNSVRGVQPRQDRGPQKTPHIIN